MQRLMFTALVLLLFAACSAANEPSITAPPSAVAPEMPPVHATSLPDAMTLAMSAATHVPAADHATSASSSTPAPSTGAASASAAGTPAMPMAGSAAPPTMNIQPAAPSGPPGISVDPSTGELVFRTSPVELKGSEESYTCFAATVDEDVVVDGFKKSAQKFVHHAQFVEALLPEPDGISVCNQQFKLTWLPIFLAGNGPSELQFDQGVGQVISAGTQLVLQMHLFNTTDQPVTQAVEIRMHKSTSPNPTPVTPWAIGSADINIPSHQSGQAQKICTQTGPVQVLAVFPHMHQLGSKMTIEVGKSMDAMQPLYTRDPFNFDDQHMEKTKIMLDTNDILRVTCDFKVNATDKEVTFGESSEDEMCFFVGFALGDSPAQADCPNLWDSLLTL